MARGIKFVELPHGVELPYVEQGDPSGVPLLLLHGFADSWHSFELVLPHLPASIHAFALTQRVTACVAVRQTITESAASMSLGQEHFSATPEEMVLLGLLPAAASNPSG